MENKKIAYIAGALTADTYAYVQNLHKMTMWGEKVRKLGYAIYVPGWDFLHGVVHGDLNLEDYFDNSQPFLKKSDIMFVCPGWENSKGTKKELVTAKECGIPIYFGQKGLDQLDELRRHVVPQSNEVMKTIVEKPILPFKYWGEIYQGYVIREDKFGGCFIGTCSERYRVALREHAARFTKQRALEYIESGYFCKEGGPFVIEDAT